METPNFSRLRFIDRAEVPILATREGVFAWYSGNRPIEVRQTQVCESQKVEQNRSIGEAI
jgi:hypothetical protein